MFEAKLSLCKQVGVMNVKGLRYLEDTVTVGCPVSYNVFAKSSLYSIQLEPDYNSSCTACSENGSYVIPFCSIDPSLLTCCGNGKCDGFETGISCPVDCQGDNFDLQELVLGSSDNEYTSSFQFSWTPKADMRGRKVYSCFLAKDTVSGTGAIFQKRAASTAPSFCFVFDVEKCSFCLGGGSTFERITRTFLFNHDWLLLYNSNPDVKNPDSIPAETRLVIGPTYTVKRGDTVMSIA
eukprot:763429-Hanusia_phi.AAC.9